ncbi:Serine/threonine-protein phosphatase 7 long form like [Actinidia chinensis var. chinensis]|uniref:Serine/threonine-protein phosphatase 7 long form like n=1 Tax=Actinidia chinensis var. chinensis TaxID=1590841 RepID=A0A2R6RRY7_ACTCC|nr:Serine/threonine-protein phosphatase 7 long form like [Actinidia chinensis var. chinensis]
MKKATRRSSIGIKEGCNSVRNFSTRFSLQPFVRRVEKLTDDQKNAIKRIGFGDLLQIPYQMLSKNLLVELMERWSCEKRAFLLAPGEIALTLLDVALILGLRVTGDPVILRDDEPFSDLEKEYGASLWNRKITVASVEERLDCLGETVNEDFIRSFLLFVFGTVLFPNANGKVNSRYLSLLQRLDMVCEFAWGAAVLEDVVSWLCKRKEINVQYIGGCLIFLQIWSYEHIDVARPSLLDSSNTFPRACRWGTSRSHHRQWFTTMFKELQKNQIMWKLQLTSEESSVDTVKELLEAQSDGDVVEELPAPRYGVLFDKQEDNVRTRLHIMDQWIAELAHESEIDKVREVHGEEEDCSKEPIIQTDSEGSSSHNVPEVQREHMEHPLTLEDSSMTIVTSDEGDEENLGTKDQKLKREIDNLREENQLLKNQLLTFEEQNVELQKEAENLRRENQLLMLSSNSLVARLERLLIVENVDTMEEQTSESIGNGKGVINC